MVIPNVWMHLPFIGFHFLVGVLMPLFLLFFWVCLDEKLTLQRGPFLASYFPSPFFALCLFLGFPFLCSVMGHPLFNLWDPIYTSQHDSWWKAMSSFLGHFFGHWGSHANLFGLYPLPPLAWAWLLSLNPLGALHLGVPWPFHIHGFHLFWSERCSLPFAFPYIM